MALDAEGFDRVKIVASSGFGPAECRVMAAAQAPIDGVGTGSYRPEVWSRDLRHRRHRRLRRRRPRQGGTGVPAEEGLRGGIGCRPWRRHLDSASLSRS